MSDEQQDNLPVKRQQQSVEAVSHDEVELVGHDVDEPAEETRLVPIYEDYKVVEHVPADELDARIEQAKAELEEAVAASASIIERPEEEVDETTGTALILAGQSADVVKRNMGELRVRALKSQKLIKAKKKQIDRLAKAKEAELERFVRNTLEPLQKMMKQMQEGIWTINLYLGRDEFLVQIQDGEPAPADEPIVVRQRVLAMDQEMAVAAESGGIDSTSVRNTDDDADTIFDRWLRADPAHIEQVIPERKAIVALQPRFGFKNYDDPWTTRAIAEANRETYFLIRNGDKLYRVSCEFEAGRKLIPSEQEFVAATKDTWGRPIKPGTKEWLEAEEAAGAKQRHFMRIALVLQGLVDRTAVLHPLPPEGISFITMESYESGRVKLVTDAEKLLDTGRESFGDWQKRLNTLLRPGLRVIGAFNTDTFKNTNEYWERDRRCDWKHSRIHPPRAEFPKSLQIHTLEKGSNGQLVIRYARTEEVYDPSLWVESKDRPGWGHYGGYKTPKTKASCTIKPTDKFLIPVDLASIEDMEYYLQSRTNRHEYAKMFPVLKAAIAAKKAEAEEEAPFRTMLTGALVTENGVSVEDAEAAIDDLIQWYKLGNKIHRALTADDSKATRLIVKEHAARLKAADADEAVGAKILAQYPDALVIGRRKDGKYMAYLPANDGKVFVHHLAFTPTGRPSAEWDGATRRDWILPNVRSVSSWQQLHVSDRWLEWDLTAKLKQHFTGPEIDGAATQVKDMIVDDHAVAVTLSNNPDHKMPRFQVYSKPEPKPYEVTVWRAPEQPRFKKRDVYVKRAADGSVVLKNSEHLDTVHQRWDAKGLPWDDEGNLLWDDPRVRILIANEEREYRELLAAHNALDRQVSNGEASIERQWVAREWQRRYERFIDEHPGGADLWEDHKQVIRDVRYPYDRHRDDSAVALLLKVAIHQDVAIKDRPLRDIAVEVGAVEDEKGRMTYATEVYDSFFGRMRDKSFTVPADVLDFVVDTEKYVEPEDDADDDSYDEDYVSDDEEPADESDDTDDEDVIDL